MKLVTLSTILAAVTASPFIEEKEWPWQVGKVYRYDVTSHTVTSFEQGTSNGHGIKTDFLISVKAFGHLVVKLENSQYLPVKANLSNTWELPSGLKYEPFQDLDQIFEIYITDGRVIAMKFHSLLSVTLENVLKGLIGALQVDLTNIGYINTYPNSYDKEAFQGVFKKMETDVTGSCETLYSISPLSSAWRREIPKFSSEEDPIEIVKSRNYGNCDERIGSVTGVPDDVVWPKLAPGNNEGEFITHNSEARLLVGKTGTIYKSQNMGSVHVTPLIYGKQKAEVYTHTTFLLNSVSENSTFWQMSKDFRSINSLQYTQDPSTNFYPPGSLENIGKAKRILQEISPLLQDPDGMLRNQFLLRFNQLVYILASFSAEQLTQINDSLSETETFNNIDNMWTVYRNAVALSGTPEAFKQIKYWIFSNQVADEEAAELVTAIGASISKASNALLEDFFHFASCERVTRTKFLNNSALLASTKLLRLAEDNNFIIETVIPYLTNQLKHAVKTGDSKYVVYLTVLGNLAHPAILNEFAPYLDGQIPVSKYFRTQIVTNLRNLAIRQDAYVRSVLFSIIRNTGEPYEVRVAAAQNIFLTFPTFDMMRILAYIAKNDLNAQVRAVLKSGIIYAAELKDPRFTVLAKSAQAVLDLIPKEKSEYQYSTESMYDGHSSDNEFRFFREFSYISSDDYYLPKFLRSALRFMGNGLIDENQVTLSISSFQDLLQLFTMDQKAPVFPTNIFKYNAQYIYELLNLKRKTRNPVEASLFIELLSQQKLFNFRLNDFNTIRVMAVKIIPMFMRGFRFTKLLYIKKIDIVFPLVNGMPFFFHYSEPLAIQTNFEISPFVYSIPFKADITFSRNIDGSVGYMNTLKNTFVAAGVVSQIQIHLPIKLKYLRNNADSKQVVFDLLLPGNNVNVFHFSVIPYTGVQNQNSIDNDLNFIKRSNKIISNDVKFGFPTGVMYQFQAFSYSTDYKNVGDLLQNDIWTTVGNLLYQRDAAYTKINLKYLGTESNIKTITFSLYASSTCHTLDRLIKFENRERCRTVAEIISTGIESARVKVIDVSAEFRGIERTKYVFTAGYAYSYGDSKYQAGFLANSNQIKAFFKYDTNETKVAPLNFEHALKNKIEVTYEADINYEKMYFNLKGYGVRSKEYTELLRSELMAKQCLKEMTKENYYQLDCRKMIVKAHAPDYFKATVSYKNFDSEIPWYGYVYKALKKACTWDVETNLLKTTANNTLEIEAQGFYYENFINYKLLSKYGQLKLNNVKGLWYYPYPGIAVDSPSTPLERIMNYYSGYQYLPYCAVDGNKVKTFSGRSYDYTLTSSWHVVMVDRDNDLGRNLAGLVILARRPNLHQLEVYVSLDTGHYTYIEVDIKPENITIKTSNEVTTKGGRNLTTYWTDDFRTPLLDYFSLAEGIKAFSFWEGRIRLIYDQYRLIIFTDGFRTTTKGICGENSGEILDDYMTPWGLVDRPDHYGASFSLDEDADNKTLALKAEAKMKAYLRVTTLTKIPRYNSEWTETKNKAL